MKSKIYFFFLVTFALIFSVGNNISAQNYILTTSTGNTIVPGTVLVPGSQADDAVINVPIPFPYTVYGTVYNSVGVGTNGNLQFTTTNATFSNSCLPTTAAVNMGRAFMPHWDDMLPTGTGQGIFTSISGVAPNRIFNIEWRSNYFGATGTANFEARLFEGLQRVDFIYGVVANSGISATIGVQRENAPTTFFTQHSCNTASVSSGLRLQFEIPPPLIPCVPGAAQIFTNSTPVAIPTGPAVVTSSITVSGALPYLQDLNLTTFITHTFAADLDITIQSPAGTIVTLTTDNGAGNDDVFNGTIWDDDANPAGQVPYTTNNGLVTDHAYVNLSLASPLVPEEALGAFIGENPNGTWTITISDDLAGDGGSLDSWSLAVSGLPAAPVTALTTATNSTPVAVPTGPGVVTSTLLVAGAGTQLLDVNLTTFLTHTFAADLDVTIMSPAGTIVTLTTDNGAGNDDVFNGTIWDDDANPAGQVPYTTNTGLVTDHPYVNLVLASPLAPEEALAAFIGENPNGTWTLTISDDLAGDGGSLNSWTLNLTTSLCAPAPTCIITCPANIIVTNTPGQCGAIVNYPPPTTAGACGTVTATPASGSFFPVGTTTVTATSSVGGGTCSFTITVNDNQAPTITCPGNMTANNTAGTCAATITTPNPTASDNCPVTTQTWALTGATVASSPATGVQNVGTRSFNVGVTTVTYTVRDSGGNTATCSFTVTVTDTQNPTITCPANMTATNTPGACSASVTTPAPTNADNCAVTRRTWALTGATTGASPATGINSVGTQTFNVGVTTVTYIVADAAGNTATCSFTVTVTDTQNPTITCPANMTVTTPIGSCTAIVNYTVPFADNCPGSTIAQLAGLPSGSAFPIGTTTNTFRVTDAAGNTATCSFNVLVNDGQLPVVTTPPANRTVCRNSNATFNVVSTNTLSYQWQQWNGSAWVNIPGATGTSYTVTNAQLSMNTNSFRVVATGLCSVVPSSHATLFVNNLPTVSLAASNPILSPGQTTNIVATASPAGGTYVWYLNGSVIVGASGTTLSNLGVDDLGVYHVVYTDLNGCVSTSATLEITAETSSKLFVYPNPNRGQFQVRVFAVGSTNPLTVVVFDHKGAKVYEKQFSTVLPYTQMNVDLGMSASGIYTVRVHDASGNIIGARSVVVRHD